MSAIGDKIRKLLNLARDKSASEGEAATAMRLAMELMARHGIEEADLVQREIDWGSRKEADAKWKEVTAWASASLYGCRAVFERTSEVFVFVGREDNRLASEMTYDFLCEQIERWYKTYLPPGMSKRDRAQFRRGFKVACALRVYDRVDDMMKPQATGSALVLHIDSITKEVDDFLEAQGGTKTVGKAVTIKNANEGHLLGAIAGDQIQLRKEVS
jgi:cytosine/adenosine deaminase-related metal-dependent hydrolase